MFVHASSEITFTAKFVPITGFPAEGVNPFWLIAVILYVRAATELLKFKETPEALSLQIVLVWFKTTGSGLMVAVTVKGWPEQPLLPFGTIV